MRYLTAVLALLIGAPLHAQTLRGDADGAPVIGDVRLGPQGREGPVVLLFHQGGGNARGEYRSIAPRLIAEGFSVITFDIRGGGDRFDAVNRVPTSDDFRYCAAIPDVDAAVDLARADGFVGPLAVWGSSYSATLVLHVAAARSDVDAVLSFSPAAGEPMDDCQPVSPAALLARRQTPLLVLRPAREAAQPRLADQLRTFRETGIAVHVSDPGAHGSSMLDADRTGSDVSADWSVVLAFLRSALTAPSAAH